MSIAYRLNIPEEAILEWPAEKFERWMAFFQIIEPKKTKQTRRR